MLININNTATYNILLRKGTNRLLGHPAFSMQRCKCVDIHRSGKRTPSGPPRVLTEGNWSHEGCNRGKIYKVFRLAGI